MEQLGLKFYQKLAEPGAFLHDLNNFFSRCQDELIEPDDFDAYVRGLETDFHRRLPQLDPAEQQRDREGNGEEAGTGASVPQEPGTDRCRRMLEPRKPDQRDDTPLRFQTRGP